MQAPPAEALGRRADPRGTYNLGQDPKWRRILRIRCHSIAPPAPAARSGTHLSVVALDGDARNLQLEPRTHGRAQPHLLYVGSLDARRLRAPDPPDEATH